MYAGVNSNSPGRSCDPEVRMRTDQRVPRGSRMPGSRDVMDGTRARAHGRDTRHGAQAQPTCANTPRPRPRRLLLGTFEKCLLRSTSIGCSFVLRSPGSSTAGTPWLRETRRRPTRQSQEAFSTLHPLPAAFERAARAPRHCPGVPTMHHGSRSCPGLEHENHHTSAATESSTEGQRPPERDPHE